MVTCATCLYLVNILQFSQVKLKQISFLTSTCFSFWPKEIDRKEARVNAMRSAILETFPDPNRRLLQRYTLLVIC